LKNLLSPKGNQNKKPMFLKLDKVQNSRNDYDAKKSITDIKSNHEKANFQALKIFMRNSVTSPLKTDRSEADKMAHRDARIQIHKITTEKI